MPVYYLIPGMGCTIWGGKAVEAIIHRLQFFIGKTSFMKNQLFPVLACSYCQAFLQAEKHTEWDVCSTWLWSVFRNSVGHPASAMVASKTETGKDKFEKLSHQLRWRVWREQKTSNRLTSSHTDGTEHYLIKTRRYLNIKERCLANLSSTYFFSDGKAYPAHTDPTLLLSQKESYLYLEQTPSHGLLLLRALKFRGEYRDYIFCWIEKATD